MKEVIVSHHFPTVTPPDNGKGKWKRAAVKVGRVRPDGKIEHTPYRFRKRTVKGGIAYTSNSELVDLPNGNKQNPATGEVFVPTKKTRNEKRKAWWGRQSKTYVPPSYLERKRRVQS